MSGVGLNQIKHARRGIPWVGVTAVAAPAFALFLSSFIWYRSGPSWGLLRWGLLLWAVTAAFLLDEPSDQVVRATVRSPWWWHGARFLGGVPLILFPILVANLWAAGRPAGEPDPSVEGMLIQSLIGWLLVLAAAAIARRFGREAPGDVVASSAILAFLLLMIIPFTIRGIPLLPWAGDPRWDESIRMWLIPGWLGLATLVVAIWPPRRRGI